ncbi:MAG TPA: TrbI/VirB10 family protein [Acidisarcina sp.]
MPEDKQNSEMEPPAVVHNARLRDARSLPEGVVPGQAQGYVVAGLAVLILGAVMFSKNHAKPATKEAVGPPVATSTDMNQRKIQELAQDLTESQRQVEQQQKSANAQSSPGASLAPANPATVPASQLAPTVEPPRDPVADAERELAFKARFASNLVSADAATVHASVAQPDEEDPIVRSKQSGDVSRPGALPQPPAAADTSKRPPEVSVNSAHGQPYVIFEGTTIDTVLANRLDGEFAGPVKVMVTNPVYSQDRQHVLVPEGSFLLGDVQKVASFGQKRLAVTFHRLLMPDGYSVDLDQFHGLDQVGDTGLRDKVNNHYVEIFGTSIALGVIAGAGQSSNSTAGLNQSGSDSYKSGIASSLSQSSTNVLDKFINIPPTITIREGQRIKVYITQDMLLPAYENHTVPGDI